MGCVAGVACRQTPEGLTHFPAQGIVYLLVGSPIFRYYIEDALICHESLQVHYPHSAETHHEEIREIDREDVPNEDNAASTILPSRPADIPLPSP